ncbi:MAG TPA: DUF2062 domain-containing protein [Desulfobacterales bacterium]
MNRFLNPLRRAYERFLKIRGHPREIALGFALGLFVGMTPFMGAHTLIAVPLAALFKWNKISAAVAVWVTNAFTAPIIYGITYMLGASLVGATQPFGFSEIKSWGELFDLILDTPEIFWAMSVGGIILGIPLAVMGYYFAYTVVSRYQEKRKKKLAKSKKKLLRKKTRKSRRPRKQPRTSPDAGNPTPASGKQSSKP